MRIEKIGTATLYLGDCLDALKGMPDCIVDSVVTDPPYGLRFMDKKWDYDVPSEAIWVECLRVLKPGGHLLAFAGTRTQHRMAVRIEDAGFEIRDLIAWVYGSGFPKSHNVGKSIDREAGAEREVIGKGAAGSAPLKRGHVGASGGGLSVGTERSPEYDITAPATEAARQWQGWGTALKPALEPITVARKPLIGTVAENVLAHGTGAINVDASRVEGSRWPANLIHDGSDEVIALTGEKVRFFYCAKASRIDRNEGLTDPGPQFKKGSTLRDAENLLASGGRKGNHHPTVKPTDLMRYLCRLVTPPGGIVLDPFMGSGSTGKAALLEEFHFVGIERESEYFEIAKTRICAAQSDCIFAASASSGQMDFFEGAA